jgi:hypothetical protein
MRTIVSGASSNHYRSLNQLLRSVRKWCPTVRLVVWDLGLTEQEVCALETTFAISVRCFNYSKYPAYFDIRVNAGEYAWKPALLGETVQDISDGAVLWLDAGDVVVGPLDPVFEWIETVGLYSTYTSGTVSVWNHPGMFTEIDPVYRSYMSCRMLNGAIIGFDPRHPCGKEFIDTYAKWGCTRTIIAPPGSSRANHRQDQSCLTLIMWHLIKARRLAQFPVQFFGCIQIHRDCDT